MPTSTARTLTSFACLAWLVVGGCGLWGIVVEDSGDNWETPYLIFAIALFLGAALNLAAVWIGSQRISVRRCAIGLGVCVVGLLSTVVAWALPLWMTRRDRVRGSPCQVCSRGDAPGLSPCRRTVVGHGCNVRRDRR